MQQTPLSANINAPASITKSKLSSSRTTAAVKPAADDALPDVYTALGEKSATCFRNCDLAVLGSPTIQQFISPRSDVS